MMLVSSANSIDSATLLKVFERSLMTKNNKEVPIQIMSSNSVITNLNRTKFLGLTIDSTLSWKDHMVELTTKLNKACFATWTIKTFMSFNVLRTVYFSYFHTLLYYGIIFWGNSRLSTNVFKIQKRIIRIITNKGKRDSCRQPFKTLQILTVPSQYIYIYSLLVFVIKNRWLFLSNSEIHNINTRYNHNFQLISTNLTIVQKGVHYSGSKVFNYLPEKIKILSHDLMHFKSVLKNFLNEHTFYSLEEFYQLTSNWPWLTLLLVFLALIIYRTKWIFLTITCDKWYYYTLYLQIEPTLSISLLLQIYHQCNLSCNSYLCTVSQYFIICYIYEWYLYCAYFLA